MQDSNPDTDPNRSRDGLISAVIAYLAWGFLPIYFIVVKMVPAFEVLSHRVIWAVPFGAAIIAIRGQWSEVRAAIKNRTTLAYLAVTAVLIAGNWFVYVLAVQAEQIFQASLGYYITPMLFALVGVFVLGEQLRNQQVAAISLAGIGVAVLAFSGGTFPIIAIFLGITFTAYGVLRKKIVVGAMPGLFIETLVLVPFALAYLAEELSRGDSVFFHGGSQVSWLLTLAGPLTVIPLVFFALAAKRLMLATIGMLQFIGPTIQFFVGLVNGETLTTAHVVCFVCIWVAAVLFSVDAWGNRRPRKIAVS